MNAMSRFMTVGVRSVSMMAKMISSGDLDQQLTIDARGEWREMYEAFNTMSESIRVRSIPPDQELSLLKAQLEDVVRVCDAIIRGDFSRRLSFPAQVPVMAQLKDVINNMVSLPVGDSAHLM